MLTTLTILTTAVALIAVQPLLLRVWPQLDARNRPAPSLWDALHAAATTLPIPPPPGEAFVPSALGPEYSTVRPVVERVTAPPGTTYNTLTEEYTTPDGSRLNARELLNLRAAMADGHAQVGAHLRDLEYRRRQHELDLQRQMGNAAANAARGIGGLLP